MDSARHLDVVIPMYNMIEYSDIYSKTSESLWQYYRTEITIDNNSSIVNFPGNSALFKFNTKITGKTPEDDNTKDVKM